MERLPYVRDLGLDVLYFPPIHPIGMTNRKGRNNALVAEPGDPGSTSYAIGSEAGGHTEHSSGARIARRLSPACLRGTRTWRRDRARFCGAVLARSSVDQRTSGVVRLGAGWFDKIRREPSEKV